MNAFDRLLIKKRRVCFFTALRLRTKSFEIIQTERFGSTLTLYVIFFCTTKSFFSLLLISGSWKGHSFISFASQRNRVVIFSSSSFSFLNYHPVKAILP